MSTNLEKTYQNNKNQIYYVPDNFLKLDMKYLYVYRNDNDEVEEIISNEFPLMEFVQFKGFLFTTVKKIPMLPTSFMNIFKTNIKNLNNQFTDKKHEIVLKLSGFRRCSPRINTNVYFGFTYSRFMNITEQDVSKMYNEFIKSQTLTSIKDWFKYIRKVCPYDINYKNKITNQDFKEPITVDDIKIEYDIRHPKEIELIKKIEDTFDDKDSTIIILNDYNNTLDKITKLVAKRNDIVAYRDTDKLAIKYSDLLKLNLDWSIENFY